MTPKEKAVSLYESFYPQVQWKMGQEDCKDRAKQCSLIAVDEIIEALDFDWMEVQNLDREHDYWNKVKQEIDKL